MRNEFQAPPVRGIGFSGNIHLNRRSNMAGYAVTNKTDKEVWITIYEPFGSIISYGPVKSNETWTFNKGAWAVGSTYKLLAEYPVQEPHSWATTTRQTLRHLDFDSINLIGGPDGGYWQTP